MTAYKIEIRRTVNGSIDTDHYIRQCHRQRSLAAHTALSSLRALMGRLFKQSSREAEASSYANALPAGEAYELRNAA